MSEQICGTFNHQFAATAAVEQLVSEGVARSDVVLVFDESVGNAASSASAPTSVISRVSHQGEREPESGEAVGAAAAVRRKLMRDRSPENATDPASLGGAKVYLRASAGFSLDQLERLLGKTGAVSIRRTERMPAEKGAMWPRPDDAPAADVERAIKASRRGRNLR